MMIEPLQLARVTNQLSASVTASQLTLTQRELLLVENQISTGKLFSEPSDNPSAAAVTMQLQRTIEQRSTYLGNISNAQSQLGQVDNSLGSLTTLIQQAQNIASSDVNSDVTPAQRQADSQIISSIYNQVLSLSNTQYNGLYLFGGDKNTAPPFVTKNGGVQFVGSGTVLQNSVDTTTDVPFMVSGADVFGATSSQVQGSADLTPALTAQTRISDLRGATGIGVQLGAVQISNGTTTKLVDLSNADTIGDVVNAINSAGVGGITATIANGGLTLGGNTTDNITVADVAKGQTAAELGILKTTGGGPGVPLVGTGTQPNVTVLTPLSALRDGAGIDLHGLKISNGTQSAAISFASATTVGDLLNDINGSSTAVQAQINAAGTGIDIVNPTQGLQMTVTENGGTSADELGLRSFSTQTPLSDLNGGKGVTFAPSGADLKITPSNGASFSITLAGAKTVQDVLDKINAASGGTVTAGFSANSNGITLTDSTPGPGTLSVTNANGSTAAGDLGLNQNAPAGNTITGADVNPITAAGVFANLAKLRDSLQGNDQAGITEAAGGLQGDYQRIINTRGAAGRKCSRCSSGPTRSPPRTRRRNR